MNPDLGLPGRPRCISFIETLRNCSRLGGLAHHHTWTQQLLQFLQKTRAVNPDVAPIGSTDYHAGNPLRLCRPYVIADEVSWAGVLDTIRRGRTVASGPGDRLVCDAEHVRAVKAHLRPPQPGNFGYSSSTWLAFAALLSLAMLVLPD